LHISAYANVVYSIVSFSAPPHIRSDYTLYLDSLEQQSIQGPSGFSIQLPTSSSAGQQPVLFMGGIDSGVAGFQELQGLSTFQGCLKDFGYNYR